MVENQSKCSNWNLYLLLFTFFLGSFISLVEGDPQEKYAVVIDADLEYPLAYAFKFTSDPSEPFVFAGERIFFSELEQESDIEQPLERAEAIKILWPQVQDWVPESHLSSTPVIMKANTESIQVELLTEIQNWGFPVQHYAVEFITDAAQSIYEWLAMNFLLGRFNRTLSGENTVAILDLGEESAQIRFVEKKPETSLADSKYTILFPNTYINIIAKKYKIPNKYSIKYAVLTGGKNYGNNRFKSECINPAIKSIRYIYNNQTYDLSGKESDSGFGECIGKVKEMLRKVKGRTKPDHLKEHEIIARGILPYMRAYDAGMVFVEGGAVAVRDYLEKAWNLYAQGEPDKVFLCFDLVYIYVLLTEEYGLADDKIITLCDRVNGVIPRWELGCAYANMMGGVSLMKT